MPFDSNGTFNRVIPGGWKADAAAGIKITAVRHDDEDDGFATGLSTCITKDGRTQPIANIPMNGKKIVNLGDPTSSTDAVTKSYVDAIQSFNTGLSIAGADINGQLHFTSPTGANGLTFTGADLSWLARLAAAPSADYPNRMVLNDKPDGSGTDVVSIADNGFFSFNANSNFISNGYYKSSAPAAWKAIGSGFVVLQQAASSDGAWRVYSTAASIAANADAALNQNFIVNANGTASSRAAFTAGGRVTGTDVLAGAGGNVYANNGASYLSTDGNVVGSVWGNWGANDAYSAIGARIEARATAWANDRVSNLQYRRVSAGSLALPGAGTTNTPAGSAMTGVNTASGYVTVIWYMYLQVYDPVRGWVGFTG